LHRHHLRRDKRAQQKHQIDYPEIQVLTPFFL
jgi:hypothetical protein